MKDMIFSSESVCEGHPDKVCDCISDSVLDAALAIDPNARVACETVAAAGMIMMVGEMTFNGSLDFTSIARDCLHDIGYRGPESGFDGASCAVLTNIGKQSPDIAMGVNSALEFKNGQHADAFSTGAGDQGMMFGFACRETDVLMPAPIEYAHRLTRKLAQVRKSGQLPFLRPDGKAMVSVKYKNGAPESIPTVVLSTQHMPDVSEDTLKESVVEEVIKTALPAELLLNTRYLINPTGRFVVGGPTGDSGLTGRKIIVDTYGGYARHGGGAFSGKDPTKVDRSAAYYARYIAKNIVAAGLAERCELQIAYAIGVATPVSVLCDTFGTGTAPDDRIANAVKNVFDMRPAAIIAELGLRAPIYRQTAAYGHFGRADLNLPWERCDRVEQLKAQF